jgi:hypothetical protein
MDNIAIKKSALGIDQIQNLPQSSIEDIKSTKGASKLLYVAATGVFTLVNMPSQSLKSISIQNKDIETSIYLKNDKSIDLDYKNFISQNYNYEDILINVVNEMTSNEEDFSEFDKHIQDNFWDLI